MPFLMDEVQISKTNHHVGGDFGFEPLGFKF